ncbi:MAG: aminotransferase class I/II-fold pyridoxal phosphate-dependent enzyme [Desulfovibrionales bacterium]|nr:aminotransferase class I/II-fold pyridoxal phosphate-dependent enzyme [Desulfovibrionales bacterium]
MHPLYQRLSAELLVRREQGLARTLQPVTRQQGALVHLGGQSLIDFASNDVLGLARDAGAAHYQAELCMSYGCGAGASRLVTGTTAELLDAEQRLADFFGYESCLILNSGFVANLTVLGSLFCAADTVAVDTRIHASTMAGILASGARFHSFRHNSLRHLQTRIASTSVQAVVTESLFSMDGDSPDFAALAALKARSGFLTLVDEAHAFGVLGAQGKGLARGVADMAIGTLGKAFGLFGAFFLGPARVRDYLINCAPAFIYTTALPPWFGPMVCYLLDRVAQAEREREHVRHMSARLRTALTTAGLAVRGSAHILVVRVGKEERCQQIVQALRERGFLVFAARYPTVPLGHAVVRICVHSLHCSQQIDNLAQALISTLCKEDSQ